MLAEFLARTVIRMSWSLLRDRWKSCQGWPFAILFFGGLLLEKDKQDVLSKLEHNTNYCLPFPSRILPYSYYNLPFHLKPCFLYFAVFPEGFKISTRQLHQLWIAEGFIHENSEATAECYSVELVDRGFIQAMRTTSVGRQNQNVLYSWYFAADIHLQGWNCGIHQCGKISTRSIIDHSKNADVSQFVILISYFLQGIPASHLSSFLCLTPNRGYLAPTECDYISWEH